MLIAELSRRSALSRDTIRFYEKAGLIQVPQGARRTNNYKEYSEANLRKLTVIQNLRSFGFTLAEIAGITAAHESDPSSCPENAPRLRQKLLVITEKIRALSNIERRLRHTLASCPDQCPQNCCLDRALRDLRE